MTAPSIRIGAKSIGAAHPPLIVAEMSANHRGSLDEALAIVRAAAAHGADAIKLQTFTPHTLTLDSARPEFVVDDPPGAWHGRRLWDLYAEAHTPWAWHEPIFDLARSLGLACLSSAFDSSSVDFLLELDVDAIKIASFELVHVPLLEAAGRSGKPVVLSTGMATAAELDDAVLALRASGCERFVLLKCTSAYPSNERDANILAMQAMSLRYACQVGFSDHCLSPYASYAAVALGAVIVEKHVVLSRAAGGVDAAFSIEPPELRSLAEGARAVWLSRGDAGYGPRASERASIRERPSIYVVRSMRQGERFTEENLRIVRPGNGLPPRRYAEALGRRAACDIDGETPLASHMLG